MAGYAPHTCYMHCTITVREEGSWDHVVKETWRTNLSNSGNAMVGSIMLSLISLCLHLTIPPSQKLVMPGATRRHSAPGETSPLTSPTGKSKNPLLDTLQKPPLIPKEAIGQFAHLPQYLKVFDTCKAAHTNYEVSQLRLESVLRANPMEKSCMLVSIVIFAYKFSLTTS